MLKSYMVLLFVNRWFRTIDAWHTEHLADVSVCLHTRFDTNIAQDSCTTSCKSSGAKTLHKASKNPSVFAKTEAENLSTTWDSSTAAEP